MPFSLRQDGACKGRGRLSGFTLPFHEKLVQGVTWNYYKLRNGSYREFIPDNYVLDIFLYNLGIMLLEKRHGIPLSAQLQHTNMWSVRFQVR
jgi:hypothetical protein